MVEVKGRVKKVMADARAADTVVEELMEGILRRCCVGIRVCSKFCGVNQPDVGCVWIQ
jgi:hypothetical protein